MANMSPAELLAALEAAPNYEQIDNPIIAARMDTPPPPNVAGMAPAGAYNVMGGYTPMDNPVAREFVNAMPEAAHIPEIKTDMKSAFADPSLSQEAPQVDNTFTLGAPS